MEKKSFEEFNNEIVSNIKEYLPEAFSGADIQLQVVKKNNNLELVGLIIRNSESNITPTIYLDRFYEDYSNGADMGTILSKIARIRLEHDAPNFDVSSIMDFEQVRGMIVPRLINADMNETLLREKVNTRVADLAVVYVILLEHDFDGTASITITNDLLRTWSIETKELHDIALENLPKLLPSSFKGMSEVMREMIGMDMDDLGVFDNGEEQMYVLTNEKKINGASAVLDSKTMEDILDKVGEFYILPSSIHELLIVPKRTELSVDNLETMVREVNANEVQIEEQLSDNIYSYSVSDGLVKVSDN